MKEKTYHVKKTVWYKMHKVCELITKPVYILLRYFPWPFLEFLYTFDFSLKELNATLLLNTHKG